MFGIQERNPRATEAWMWIWFGDALLQQELLNITRSSINPIAYQRLLEERTGKSTKECLKNKKWRILEKARPYSIGGNARLKLFGHVLRIYCEYISRRKLKPISRRTKGSLKRRFMKVVKENIRLVGAREKDPWREQLKAEKGAGYHRCFPLNQQEAAFSLWSSGHFNFVLFAKMLWHFLQNLGLHTEQQDPRSFQKKITKFYSKHGSIYSLYTEDINDNVVIKSKHTCVIGRIAIGIQELFDRQGAGQHRVLSNRVQICL